MKQTIKPDKIKHFSVCAVLAFVVACVEGALDAEFINCLIVGLVAGTAIGVGKEYGDRCAPGNRWDWGDIAADVCGAVAGAVFGACSAFFL